MRNAATRSAVGPGRHEREGPLYLREGNRHRCHRCPSFFLRVYFRGLRPGFAAESADSQADTAFQSKRIYFPSRMTGNGGPAARARVFSNGQDLGTCKRFANCSAVMMSAGFKGLLPKLNLEASIRLPIPATFVRSDMQKLQQRAWRLVHLTGCPLRVCSPRWFHRRTSNPPMLFEYYYRLLPNATNIFNIF